jgi:hypothetical protein
MSVICSKCGIQTRDGAKFCHGCGNPIATAALPPTMPISPPAGEATPKPAVPLAPEAPTNFAKPTEGMGQPQTSYLPQPAAQAPIRTYPQSIEAPRKSGNGLKIFLGIIVFLGVIIVGAIGGGIFLAGKAIDNAKTSIKNNGGIDFGNNVKVKMGDAALNEAELKVPIYPGAKATMPFSISGQDDNGKKGSFGIVTLETGEDYDTVVDWYDEKLGKNVKRTSREENEKSSTTFEIKDGDGFRSVEIIGYSNNNKDTEIKIVTAAETFSKEPTTTSSEPPPAKAGKTKNGVTAPPVPPTPESLEAIEKQVNDSLKDAEKQIKDATDKLPIPAKAKKEIQEKLKADQQERRNATPPNQD